MPKYLSQEVELSRRHNDILSQRVVLLQQMESQLENVKAESESCREAHAAARIRNQTLINDIVVAEKSLHAKTLLKFNPDVVNLETCYWASIEESIPRWEHFLLGRAHSPVGAGKQKHAVRKQDTHQKEIQTTKYKERSPPGLDSKGKLLHNKGSGH
ncbi:centrosomal protein 15 [Lissotriton helveticus]